MLTHLSTRNQAVEMARRSQVQKGAVKMAPGSAPETLVHSGFCRILHAHGTHKLSQAYTYNKKNTKKKNLDFRI